MQITAPSRTAHHDAAETLESDLVPGAAAPDPAARPSRPGRYLVAQRDGTTTVIPLVRDITRIGRAFTADVRLDDHTVSRRHAILVLRAGGAHLLDDRSANGTFLNGRPISEATLRDGDVIVAGRMVLTYRVVA